MQCTCAGGTLEATITVRAEGAILSCTTSPVIGSITLGDPLPDTDPEIALRIYYAQAGEEVFAVARRFHVAPAQIHLRQTSWKRNLPVCRRHSGC